MSFLQTLLESWSGSARRRKDLIDILLMVGLADGELGQRDLDRIARAIELREELQGQEWSEIAVRGRAIAKDRPDFADTRERIAFTLQDQENRRFALSMAVRFLGTPVSPQEQRLLENLADDFELAAEERVELLRPWDDTDPRTRGYVRSRYNDPAIVREESIFEAMASSGTETELSLITFKLTATRAAMNLLSEETELVSVGDLLEIEAGRFRVDAFLQAGDQHWLARFLADGEALHPSEHELLPAVLDNLDPSVKIFIGCAHSLPPMDAEALDTLDSTRLLVERLEV